MSTLLQDLRHGLRLLLRSPTFSLITILTLAVGIGVNSAMFSVINAVLIRALPYDAPDRLVQITRFEDGDDHNVSISAPNYQDWRTRATTLEFTAATDFLPGGMNLAGDGPPERLQSLRVGADFFRVLGVAPVLGRDFLRDEDQPGRNQVVILSHDLWKRRFGAASEVVGRTLSLGGVPYTVVGVLPAGFTYPIEADVWTPLPLAGAPTDRTANTLQAIGRLKAGVSLDQAQAELDTIAAQMKASDKNPEVEYRAELVPLKELIVGDVRPALLVLAGAVGFVLLIACGNVANLLLSRGTGRRKELAVRAALGASRGRLVRQLLTESVLLALIGGGLGLVLAQWGIDALLALGRQDLPRLNHIGIDRAVLGFTVAISCGTGLLFGLAPALRASSPTLQGSLKEGEHATGSGRSGRLQSALVVAEIALALMLLVGAGLLVNSFLQLRSVDPGFDPRPVMTAQLSLPESRYGDAARLSTMLHQVSDQLEASPGVSAAGAVFNLPTEVGPDLPFQIEGRPPPTGDDVPSAQYRAATPHYFQAMGIKLVRGRLFTAQDSSTASGVVLINETTARRYWPDEDPIGKRIAPGMPIMPQLADPAPREIIGVVADVREQGLERRAPMTIYIPYAQLTDTMAKLAVQLLPTALVVRGSGAPESLSRTIQQAVWAVDPLQPVSNFRPLSGVMAGSVAPQQFNALLIGVFAAVALVLSCVGIYGVMSFSVSQRVHEIGIRMALGAEGSDVLRMVLRKASMLVALGIGIGLAGSFALTRVISSLLYGISPTDPWTFAGLSAVLAAVALLASYVPARRATQVDPIVVLRGG